jgi:hypothetical protein
LLGSSLRFAFSVVWTRAISLVLFSQALPSTRYFDHRDLHVEVAHNICELEARFRIPAVMFGVHCPDPLPRFWTSTRIKQEGSELSLIFPGLNQFWGILS